MCRTYLEDNSDRGGEYEEPEKSYYLTLKMKETLELDGVTFVQQNLGLIFTLLFEKIFCYSLAQRRF